MVAETIFRSKSLTFRGDHPLALVSFWDNQFDPGRNRVSGSNSMGIGTPLRKPSTGGESKERPAPAHPSVGYDLRGGLTSDLF